MAAQHLLNVPLVVMLGFAGGTPADLEKYRGRLYAHGGAAGAGAGAGVSPLVVCASEIPEV